MHWLLSVSEPFKRLTRWRLRLTEFAFEIQYKKDKKQVEPDTLPVLTTKAETKISRSGLNVFRFGAPDVDGSNFTQLEIDVEDNLLVTQAATNEEATYD